MYLLSISSDTDFTSDLFRNRLPFGKGNSSFATEPEKEITRIEFSEQGENYLLRKKVRTG